MLVFANKIGEIFYFSENCLDFQIIKDYLIHNLLNEQCLYSPISNNYTTVPQPQGIPNPVSRSSTTVPGG